jgi:hypothetical protein
MTALARAELEAVFAVEFAKLPAAERKALIDAMEGVTIWAFWESLRSDVGLTPRESRDTVEGLVEALFTQAGLAT